MNHIHCGSDVLCPRNLSFLYIPAYVRRAGIIPFIIYNNITYILLGHSKEKNPVWADLGGRSEQNENAIQTALREFGEESRYVLSVDLNRVSKILLTGKQGTTHPDQVLLVIEVDPTPYNIYINSAFQSTVPKTQYEDEMSLIQWIPYDTFLSMGGLSKSMMNIHKLLKSLNGP